MKEILSMGIRELSGCFQKRELSAVEAAKAYLKQIELEDGEIGAYLTVCGEEALQQAEEIDGRRKKGEPLPPLAGIPVGIKDNICTKGIRTTCASKMLENFVPPYDATVTEKLKAQDIVLLGKLNMDEFAMGSTTETSYFKLTCNPWDLTRVPGGSSGGSAAAVAAREAAFALGSDTGGSIRQPAAFCGVVGLKPTYGAASRYGLIAFASSLDQIGPLARTVEDCALAAQGILGHDPRDSTSVDRETPDLLASLKKGVKGMRFALIKEHLGEGLDPEIREAVYAAARYLETLGAEIVEASMPSLSCALPAYYVLSSAEASSNLARFDGIKFGYRTGEYRDMEELYSKTRSEGFGREVKRRILLGTFALSAGYYDYYYQKALKARTLVAREYEGIFSSCDGILSPVAPTTAYRIGEKTEDPLEMYLGDCYTVPVNIAGLPALSLPWSKDTEGMPIGIQLTGRAFSEPLLCRAGYALEQGSPFHRAFSGEGIPVSITKRGGTSR